MIWEEIARIDHHQTAQRNRHGRPRLSTGRRRLVDKWGEIPSVANQTHQAMGEMDTIIGEEVEKWATTVRREPRCRVCSSVARAKDGTPIRDIIERLLLAGSSYSEIVATVSRLKVATSSEQSINTKAFEGTIRGTWGVGDFSERYLPAREQGRMEIRSTNKVVHAGFK